jgi:hypothetical protein
MASYLSLIKQSIHWNYDLQNFAVNLIPETK